MRRINQQIIVLTASLCSIALPCCANSELTSHELHSLVVITDHLNSVVINPNTERSLVDEGISIKVFYLDNVERIEKILSTGLPSDEAMARERALKNVEEYGKDSLEQDFKVAYEGIFYARNNKINRYPAIIFDDQYVVYGVTDVDLALEKMENHIK